MCAIECCLWDVHVAEILYITLFKCSSQPMLEQRVFLGLGRASGEAPSQKIAKK